MSSHSYSDHSAIHRRCLEVLPWYVNKTLDDREMKVVEEHIASCLSCRRELEFHRQVNSSFDHADELDLTLQQSLDSELRRIEGYEMSGGSNQSLLMGLKTYLMRFTRFFLGAPPAVRGVLTVQTLLLVFVSVFTYTQWPGADDRLYHTLSDNAPAAEISPQLLRLVFRPDTTEPELRTLLQEIRAVIIDGPSPTGVYTVRTASDPMQALETLRKSYPVVFSAAVAPAQAPDEK